VGAQNASINTFSIPAESAPPESLLWKMANAGERFVAAALLVLLLPVLALSALLVAVLSRRSPWIAHRRIGQGGRSFWVVKLRTMWTPGLREPGKFQLVEKLSAAVALPEPKTPADARVTSRFAAWCRKYSIDECPQFWHVLRGEMALIGPRPLTASEIQVYYGPSAAELLTRKPGITGLWQIKGRSRLTYPQRRRLDLFLIRRWSFGLYLKVLLATIPRILTGRDAW
jgi:lipopolysaccharide/colanic/teichoic acid biosynthesis glycosyltransferase